MMLEIFDVEHGACALITTSEGELVMVDCGHNATTKWYPGDMLRQRGITSIDMLVVTNYDEDHVSGLVDLREKIEVRSLMRNKNVSSAEIKNLKSETGIGAGMIELCKMIDHYTGPAISFRTTGMSWKTASNALDKFDDENNLSLVFSVTLSGLTFTFTGDMENAGWAALNGPNLRSLLNPTGVLIAPHHGRESGWWDGFNENTNFVQLVVISDHYKQYKTQETLPRYAALAKGVMIDGALRKVLTTRSDGTITFSSGTNGWLVERKTRSAA